MSASSRHVARLLLLGLFLAAAPSSARADDDEEEDARRRGTTELYAFLEGGYGLLFLDEAAGPVFGAGERSKDRLQLRLGVGLGHFELRRWATPAIGGRLVLSVGGLRGEYRATSEGDVVASQGSPLLIAGAAVGPVLALGPLAVSAAPQYLFIRTRDYPETLGRFTLSGARISALGVEARLGVSLPRGVELGLLLRYAKILHHDTFLSFGVTVLFRLFRRDPGHRDAPTPCEDVGHETPFRQLDGPARPVSRRRPC